MDPTPILRKYLKVCIGLRLILRKIFRRKSSRYIIWVQRLYLEKYTRFCMGLMPMLKNIYKEIL